MIMYKAQVVANRPIQTVRILDFGDFCAISTYFETMDVLSTRVPPAKDTKHDIKWCNARHTFMINELGYVYRISPDHPNIRIGEINDDGFYEAYKNPKKKRFNTDYPLFEATDLIELGQLVNRYNVDQKLVADGKLYFGEKSS